MLFLLLVGKRAWVFITGWLDTRSEEIKTRLDEAMKLREEAQALLISYEKKKHEAEIEAERIVEQANNDAQRSLKEASLKLEEWVQRRRQLAADRVSQAEAKAVKEVRNKIISMAMQDAEQLIINQLDTKKRDAMVDRSIDELDSKLR